MDYSDFFTDHFACTIIIHSHTFVSLSTLISNVLMLTLGISCFFHNSAAAIVEDGQIICAAEEERFSRIKGDASFPAAAINFCIHFAGKTFDDVDEVIFYDKPLLKLDRIFETYLANAPRGFSLFNASVSKVFTERVTFRRHLCRHLRRLCSHIDWSARLRFSAHHMSHAASAFFPSPYPAAAIITMDGVGEWATATIGIGFDRSIKILKELRFPHSLGLFYSAFSQFLGYGPNDGEGKLMAVAALGTPRFTSQILTQMTEVCADGSFSLNMEYFGYCDSVSMHTGRWIDLFGTTARRSNDQLHSLHMDIAASAQSVIETIVLRIAHFAKKITNMDNLCLAGGVSLNCVANQRIVCEKIFKEIWIPPAPGDAGGALGAALFCQKNLLVRAAGRDLMLGAQLGPEFSSQEIREVLNEFDINYLETDEDNLVCRSAQALAHGKILGWFQGRMEFGPRALGNRSILADSRNRSIIQRLNKSIKNRDDFQPFAPAVLDEYARDWFNIEASSPYMSFAVKGRPAPEQHDENLSCQPTKSARESAIPGVLHVDGTARIQTVDNTSRPLFYKLLRAFHAKTGCPMLLNTSFNGTGRPIVCSPRDAIEEFLTLGLDAILIGNFFVERPTEIHES